VAGRSRQRLNGGPNGCRQFRRRHPHRLISGLIPTGDNDAAASAMARLALRFLEIVVATVVARLRTNEVVFLHEPGADTQCDEARASIGLQRAT
jgi:hypothetical protein